ncbi:serine/threonine protein kinase [Candidatus Woesearchaeota archaeon CG10_big_fil_rev_8_21_14_0_10_44_13]|nr:MAG: serine/threonine protein kinase [Candidatus Woesearchaeota archaeon CG10_big_fil_rev_8_21_14_0_10_44_13]
MAQTAKEKFKTYKDVFDMHTERNLFKLSGQGHFDRLEGPVSIGKEANIFTAIKGDRCVIVKIYRLETCDFNRMYDYIKMDPRYSGLKKKRRKIIFSWCQREFRNLMKARQAKIKVPMPITFRDNLLVMEFIGESEVAPKVKDKIPKNPSKFYKDVLEDMKKLHKAGLVHGDLSEFNILNYKEKPCFIDMSQASPLESANAEDLLDRDIKNIARFFSKIGVKADKDEMKKYILKSRKS